MCLIIVSPPGTIADPDRLADATWDNPNGSGWAIRTPTGLEMMRSARDIQRVHDAYWETRTRYPDAWAVWHSRFTTQGHDCDDNTHPFMVPGQPWAMAHNGVLPLNDGPFDARDRSDSRILAEDILSETTWTRLLAERERIERWLQGDKVVILSERREKGGPCLILGEDHGMWDTGDGCWYSRTYHPSRCHKCNHSWRTCTCPVTHYSTSTTTSTQYKGGTTTTTVTDADDDEEWWKTQEALEDADVRAALAAAGIKDEDWD